VANTWEVRRWRYVISYLRSLPIFFSLIRFWRRAPRHLQGQVQLLGVSKDISTTLEFSKNMSSLSVFSKNNSPLSVVCKEYLRCSACSKNIPPPFFSAWHWMKRNCVWKNIWCYCWRSTAIFSAMSLFDPPFSHFQKGGVWKSADIRNPGDLKTEIEEIQTHSKSFQFCWLSKEPGLQNV